MGEYTGSPFTRDSWEAMANRERGVEEDDKWVRLLVKMEELAERGSDFKETVERVKDSAVQYYRSVISHEKISPSDYNEPSDFREEKQAMDSNRRYAHDDLCGKIRMLAVMLHQKGIDNKFLYGMLDSRNEAGLWARKVGPVILNEVGRRPQ